MGTTSDFFYFAGQRLGLRTLQDSRAIEGWLGSGGLQAGDDLLASQAILAGANPCADRAGATDAKRVKSCADSLRELCIGPTQDNNCLPQKVA